MSRMRLPITLTNAETNETELVDVFSMAAVASGCSIGTRVMVWKQDNIATETKYKETPEQIAEKTYNAYKRAGIISVPQWESLK